MIQSNFPLISVVMATFNGARFVSEQLDSIFNQTYEHLEVIVVDDHSSDNTAAILDQYRRKFSNLRIFVNETNLGYIKNFEKGLQLASGDFIAPADQDDIWLPQKLSRLMSLRDGCPIIFSDSDLIDDVGQALNKKLSDIKRLATCNTCLNYAIGGSAPGHAMLIEKKVIQQALPLPPGIPHDYWIAFVATFTGPVKFVDESLILYRQHQHNVFGAVKVNDRKTQQPAADVEGLTRERMKLLYQKCPATLPEKQIFYKLMKAYESFSLKNNLNRMFLFFEYNEEILAFKKRSLFRRWLFCLKMFVKIV